MIKRQNLTFRIFFAQKIGWVKWTGIASIIAGLEWVGFKDQLEDAALPHATDMVIGDMLIIFAQIIVAFKFVYEEKFINKYNVSAFNSL